MGLTKESQDIINEISEKRCIPINQFYDETNKAIADHKVSLESVRQGLSALNEIDKKQSAALSDCIKGITAALDRFVKEF